LSTFARDARRAQVKIEMPDAKEGASEFNAGGI
jgi:hypothetical protein